MSTTPFSELIPDARNANKGTKRGGDLVKKSLREYGAGRSILLDKNNRVIAGNKTLEQASTGKSGIKGVRVVESDGTDLIAVRRTDLDLEHDAKAKSLAIADNRAGELSLDWDPDILKSLETEIELGDFWQDDELAELLGRASNALLTDEDEAPPVPKEAVSKLGDLYFLGKHRLLCGDSTNAEDVARLMSSEKPLLMVTDPPYGVDYDPKWRLDAGVNKPWQTRAKGKVRNDDQVDWGPAWALFSGDVAYVWHAGSHASAVQTSLESAGFAIRCQIIWAKPSLVIGRGHYHWQHEPCWYAVRAKGTGHWAGDRKQSTLWEIANMHRTQGKVDDGKTIHGTQKPVECMRRPVLNNSKPGDAVYDPFCGSGTTIIACETENRRCFAMEIDPLYCDVIIQRYEAATGIKATKVA